MRRVWCISYLVGQITPLQSQIGADVLVDGPRELVIQLPGLEGENNGSSSHQTWESNQHGSHIRPEVLLDSAFEHASSIPDLIELDGGVDEDTDVVDNETDDLNSVLQPQGVPYKPELVEVPKHEHGEVGGNCASFTVRADDGPVDAGLELAKDISVRVSTTNDGAEVR